MKYHFLARYWIFKFSKQCNAVTVCTPLLDVVLLKVSFKSAVLKKLKFRNFLNRT